MLALKQIARLILFLYGVYIAFTNISRIQLYYLAQNTTDTDILTSIHQLAPGPIWMYVLVSIIGFAIASGVIIWWYKDSKNK
jgi:hypothetical protein